MQHLGSPLESAEGGTRSQNWVSCGAEGDQNKEPAAITMLGPCDQDSALKETQFGGEVDCDPATTE